MIGTRTRGQQQRGQGDSNGNDEDDDDDPSTAPTATMTTQCRRRRHQLLYSEEPAIAGLPRCRSCCIWETAARTSHRGDKGTATGTMRTRTMTPAPPRRRRRRRHNVVVVNSSCTRRNPQLRVSRDAGAVAYGRQRRAPHIAGTRGQQREL